MILAVDIGTTSMKGGLIDSKGTLRNFHTVKLTECFSSRDGLLWVNGLKEITKKLSSKKIRALSISGNGPSFVPVDRQGTPVSSVLFWKDNTEAIFRSDCLSYYLPKAAGFQKRSPELYEKTVLFLSPHEYLIYTISGEPAGVSPHNGFDRFLWPEEEIIRYGLDPLKFPPIKKIGELIGQIDSRGAKLTGLPKGLPLFSAGNDFLAALLGTDTTKPGRTCDRAGSSEGINRCCEKNTETKSLRPLPHVKEGLFNLSSILFSTGSLFEWYRDLTGQSGLSYKETLEGIASVPSSKKIPRFYPGPGSFSEFEEGHFSDLCPHYSKWDVGKAILEAIGYAVLEGIEEIESHGYPVDKIRISGGQCKNDIWNSLKSNITGRDILVPVIKDAELAGNACAAYTGLGDFENIFEAADKIVRIEKDFSPDPVQRDLYREKYEEYRNLRPVKE